MKTKNMKTKDRILLAEEIKIIEEGRRNAGLNAYRLNSISSIFSFESEVEFSHRTSNIDLMIEKAMLARPEISRLAESIELSSLKVPEDIQDAANMLKTLVKVQGLFDNLIFDGEWIVDEAAIHAFEESHRYYATSENQIARYHMAKTLCDFLNENNLGAQIYDGDMYVNCMINRGFDMKWSINVRWILDTN